MSKARMIVAVCLCCLLIGTHAFGEGSNKQKPYESAVTTARSQIWQAINSGKCGSATAAVTVGGKVVYAEGFGMANREKGIPVTKETLFNIGSISKVYVASALMLLAEEGRVSLDRPLTDYLPEFRMADERYRQITVRMLLNHVSGIPGTEMSNSCGYEYYRPLQRETLETLSRSHLKHAPGAMAVYCNDGFTLAEMVVERLSGKTYIDFLRKRIFRPLGLKNTGLSVGEIRNRPVASYYEAGTGRMHPLEVLSVLGAGGLSATAVDVCRFADAFAPGSRLFRKASLAEMRKPQPPSSPVKFRNPTFSFGLGWDFTGLPRYDAAGIQVLGKSGGTGNYSSMLLTVPEKKISVAVIASGAQSGAMTLALEILDAVLVEKKMVAKEEKPLQLRPEPQDFPKEDVSLAGFYANEKALGRLVFDAEKKSALLHNLNGPENAPGLSLAYRNGYYHDASGNRYYFADSGRSGYLVCHPAMLKIDMIMMQKVMPVEKPKNLRINMDGKIWLRRNASPLESAVAIESHFVKSVLHKDLPGYVDFVGIKRIESPDFASMPFDAIRDQSELLLFEKDGATWAWVSDLLYSPAQSAVAMRFGEHSVQIGRDGYNQWRVSEEDMVLSFSRTQRGRIVVFSPDDTVVYNSDFDKGDVFVAKGHYVEIAGLAGDVLRFKTAALPAR